MKNHVFELTMSEELKVHKYIEALGVSLAVSVPLLLDVIAEMFITRGKLSDGMSCSVLLVFLLPNLLLFLNKNEAPYTVRQHRHLHAGLCGASASIPRDSSFVCGKDSDTKDLG